MLGSRLRDSTMCFSKSCLLQARFNSKLGTYLNKESSSCKEKECDYEVLGLVLLLTISANADKFYSKVMKEGFEKPKHSSTTRLETSVPNVENTRSKIVLTFIPGNSHSIP